MSKRKAPKSHRGTLLLLAALLVASGIIRLSGEATQAFAEEIEALVNGPQETSEENALPAPPIEAIGPLVLALQERERRVKEQETVAAARIQELEAIEIRVQQQITTLRDAEERLEQVVAKAQDSAQTDVDRLTSVYENMKPADAAVLFEQMDPDFAAGFLARMTSNAAANVMSGLTPEKAYAISVILAGRNADLSELSD